MDILSGKIRVALFISMAFTMPANAALLGRLPLTPGGADYQAYYDDVANLTWLADANYAASSGYSVVNASSNGLTDPYAINADGRMTWASARIWVSQLNVGGVTGWRLPSLTDTGALGCDFSRSGGTDCGYNVDTQTGELANLYYDVLGNASNFDANGLPLPTPGARNTGPFLNVYTDTNYFYWYDQEYIPASSRAWDFSMASGGQLHTPKFNLNYSWAVYSGDVASVVVPLPAGLNLFAIGLLSLFMKARVNKHGMNNVIMRANC